MSATHKLARQVFTKKRELDFFTESGLTAQIGYGRRYWPVVLLKELLDNALDACEASDTLSEISIVLKPDSLTVADNGPGLPESTIASSLDYELRVSDKILYVAPTRGQLGNALKAIWVLPFVAGNNSRSLVEVTACGIQHRIEITGSNQDPQIQRTTKRAFVKKGTTTKVHWQGIAGLQADSESEDFYKVVAKFACLNPHATFRLERPESKPILFRASAKDWRKWRTDQPTSAHWYSRESFRDLVGAYITHGQGRKTVREFVSEFDGLRGSQYQRKVITRAKVVGCSLADLSEGAPVRLLGAMQEATRQVVPQRLGVIGADHFRKTLLALGVSENSFQYKKKLDIEDGLPFVVEVAFGVKRKLDYKRELLLGLNFSPTFKVPSEHFDDVLQSCWLDPTDSVVLAVHQVNPRLTFTSLGKGDIADQKPAVSEVLSDLVERVTRRFKKIKWQLARRQQQAIRQEQMDELNEKRSEKEEIKAAAYAIMPKAWAMASGNGMFPANARQIMYSARKLVLAITGDNIWKHSSYFTQVLLVDYQTEHPEETKDWDVVYDARGHLTEPHATERLGLGTLGVRAYIAGWHHFTLDFATVQISGHFPTAGPQNRFRFALFIEKEGFDVLLQRSEIASRFDLAVFSSKGGSTTATRQLVDAFSEAGVTSLILHDFDIAGLNILHCLTHDTDRYRFKAPPKYIDLGLRLDDVLNMNLEGEPIPSYRQRKDPREKLREYGATLEECDFLVEAKGGGHYSGKRVELNALTAPEFIEWLERKLIAAGVTKVIPDDETLARAYRRAKDAERLRELMREMEENPTQSRVPRDLRKQVNDILKKAPALSWDAAIARIVEPIRL